MRTAAQKLASLSPTDPVPASPSPAQESPSARGPWLNEEARFRNASGTIGGIALGDVHRRLGDLSVEIGESSFSEIGLGEFLEELGRGETPSEERRDLLNTRLMEVFRNHCAGESFGLLYDLNERVFFCTIYSRARRYGYLVDASDVLQEVFLNIYRYPHRFKNEKATSFRNWAHTIIRNTLLKSLRSQVRTSTSECSVEDLSERRDVRARTPLRNAIHEESEESTRYSYAICLHLYLTMYNRLSLKERTALELVEIDGCSYRDTSKRLGIKLENLKMVVFRARKKIYRAMRKVLTNAA